MMNEQTSGKLGRQHKYKEIRRDQDENTGRTKRKGK
jgi:hypothetical protein